MKKIFMNVVCCSRDWRLRRLRVKMQFFFLSVSAGNTWSDNRARLIWFYHVFSGFSIPIIRVIMVKIFFYKRIVFCDNNSHILINGRPFAIQLLLIYLSLNYCVSNNYVYHIRLNIQTAYISLTGCDIFKSDHDNLHHCCKLNNLITLHVGG